MAKEARQAKARGVGKETPPSSALATYLCLIRAHKRKTLSIKDNERRERQQHNKSRRDCLEEGRGRGRGSGVNNAAK